MKASTVATVSGTNPVSGGDPAESGSAFAQGARRAGTAPVNELTAAEIRWQPDSARWPLSFPLLQLAVALLPEIEDEQVASLVEDLAELVIKRDEQVAAMRSVQSPALTELHRQRCETTRLQDRLIELREERRRERAPVANTGPTASLATTEGN